MTMSRDSVSTRLDRLHSHQPVEWQVAPGLVDYAQAVAFMESRAAAIAAGEHDIELFPGRKRLFRASRYRRRRPLDEADPD